MPLSTNRLQCEECERVSPEGERGWTAHLTDDEDEPTEVVIFCPECDEREFGSLRSGRSGDHAGGGLCVQALHRGPYETEPETIAAMDALMEREQLTMNGRHHDIYLTAVSEQLPPQEIKTILRHSVRPLDR